MIELVHTIDVTTVESILKIEAEAFGAGGMNEWHLVPLIRHGRVYVARVNGQVVGSVQYLLDWENPKKAYMFGIAFTREWQGKGLGTEFLKQSFLSLAKNNIEQVELTVNPNNTAAVKVYENKLGFIVTGFRNNEYGEGENRLVMQLSFTKPI